MTKNGENVKIPYIKIIVLSLTLGIVLGTSNIFMSKYILINSSWVKYQEMIDNNTINKNNLIEVDYKTLISFIENDTTDTNYFSNAFICVDFAMTLLYNLSLYNISGGLVILNFHETHGHAINCFNTIDKGIVYIEPQNDNDITDSIKILGIYNMNNKNSTIYSISTYWDC